MSSKQVPPKTPEAPPPRQVRIKEGALRSALKPDSLLTIDACRSAIEYFLVAAFDREVLPERFDEYIAKVLETQTLLARLEAAGAFLAVLVKHKVEDETFKGVVKKLVTRIDANRQMMHDWLTDIMKCPGEDDPIN